MDQYVEQEKDESIQLQIKNDDMSMVNRNTIKRIKKRLVALDPQYEGLKSKFLGSNSNSANYNPMMDFDESNEDSPRKNSDIDMFDDLDDGVLEEYKIADDNYDQEFDIMKHIEQEIEN